MLIFLMKVSHVKFFFLVSCDFKINFRFNESCNTIIIFSIINSYFCSKQLLLLMLLIIDFVFIYFWWWHLRISFNCSSKSVLNRSSPLSQFIEFKWKVRHCGGLSIAKSMFPLDFFLLISVEMHLLLRCTLNFCYQNLKTVGFYSQVSLLKSLFNFLYLLLSPQCLLSYMDLISCLISVYCCVIRPLSSCYRFLEISSIKWFRFDSLYRKFMCDIETEADFTLDGM